MCCLRVLCRGMSRAADRAREPRLEASYAEAAGRIQRPVMAVPELDPGIVPAIHAVEPPAAGSNRVSRLNSPSIS